MPTDAERAREELKLSRAMSERFWAAYRAYAQTLDPARGMASPEEVRKMAQASQWTARIYEAEHALFKAEHGTPGIVGAHGNYQWLTMAGCDISTLLRLCPEIILGKYLAVTSIDGGALQLTEEEKSKGWFTTETGKIFRYNFDEGREYRGDWLVAYSPRISSVHALPNETHDECCAGHDEWYVFEDVVPVSDMGVFVNWEGFRLYDPLWKYQTDRFWEQMERLAPESYIADGTVFTIATSNRVLFASVLSAFSESAA